MEIAAGYYQGGIVLKTNGTATGWGSSAEKLTALSTLSNLVSVEMDDLGFTCLRADGSVGRIRITTVTNPPPARSAAIPAIPAAPRKPTEPPITSKRPKRPL